MVFCKHYPIFWQLHYGGGYNEGILWSFRVMSIEKKNKYEKFTVVVSNSAFILGALHYCRCLPRNLKVFQDHEGSHIQVWVVLPNQTTLNGWDC